MPAGASGAERKRKRGLDEGELRELMIRYQNADQRAANELVRKLTPLLFGFLSSPTHGRSVTEDLVQDCWLRIHRSRHTYRTSEPVLPWIFAIARHTGLDGYRRRRRVDSREITMEQLPERPQKTETPGAALKDELGHYVDQLPASQKEVVLMLKVTGMSLEEVAGATGTTVGAVKQKAHRAYAKLRQMLSENNEYGKNKHHV